MRKVFSEGVVKRTGRVLLCIGLWVCTWGWGDAQGHLPKLIQEIYENPVGVFEDISGYGISRVGNGGYFLRIDLTQGDYAKKVGVDMNSCGPAALGLSRKQAIDSISKALNVRSPLQRRIGELLAADIRKTLLERLQGDPLDETSVGFHLKESDFSEIENFPAQYNEHLKEREQEITKKQLSSEEKKKALEAVRTEIKENRIKAIIEKGLKITPDMFKKYIGLYGKPGIFFTEHLLEAAALANGFNIRIWTPFNAEHETWAQASEEFPGNTSRIEVYHTESKNHFCTLVPVSQEVYTIYNDEFIVGIRGTFRELEQASIGTEATESKKVYEQSLSTYRKSLKAEKSPIKKGILENRIKNAEEALKAIEQRRQMFQDMKEQAAAEELGKKFITTKKYEQWKAQCQELRTAKRLQKKKPDPSLYLTKKDIDEAKKAFFTLGYCAVGDEIQDLVDDLTSHDVEASFQGAVMNLKNGDADNLIDKQNARKVLMDLLANRERISAFLQEKVVMQENQLKKSIEQLNDPSFGEVSRDLYICDEAEATRVYEALVLLGIEAEGKEQNQDKDKEKDEAKDKGKKQERVQVQELEKGIAKNERSPIAVLDSLDREDVFFVYRKKLDSLKKTLSAEQQEKMCRAWMLLEEIIERREKMAQFLRGTLQKKLDDSLTIIKNTLAIQEKAPIQEKDPRAEQRKDLLSFQQQEKVLDKAVEVIEKDGIEAKEVVIKQQNANVGDSSKEGDGQSSEAKLKKDEAKASAQSKANAMTHTERKVVEKKARNVLDKDRELYLYDRNDEKKALEALNVLGLKESGDDEKSSADPLQRLGREELFSIYTAKSSLLEQKDHQDALYQAYLFLDQIVSRRCKLELFHQATQKLLQPQKNLRDSEPVIVRQLAKKRRNSEML